MRWLLILALLTGCSGDGSPTRAPNTDMGSDAARDTAQDIAADTVDDATETADVQDPDVPRPNPGERVEIDLAALVGEPEVAESRLFEATGAADLLDGEVAAARPGDWVLENDEARFIVQADKRTAGPCPYGGNVVDAALRNGDGFREDVIGEACLVVNAGRTLDPSDFEVLETDAGPVLAVTGSLAILDFVAIEEQARDLLGGLELDIPLMPNAELPVTVTVYYFLPAQGAQVRVRTAFRNDADTPVHLAVGHLIDTGGTVSYFNPVSSRKGFGFSAVSEGQFRADPLPFLVFAGDRSSYSFVPDVDPRLSEAREFAVGGSYLTIVGAALVFHRLDDVLPVLLANAATIPELPGLLHLEAGDIDSVPHRHILGDGQVASVVDDVYRDRFEDTRTISGVVAFDGVPRADVRVSAAKDGRAYNQARTDRDGRFALVVPSGEYEVRAHDDALFAAVTADATSDVEVAVELPVTGVRVRARTPEGSPTPAKLVAVCDPAPCVHPVNSLDRDVHFDTHRDDAVAGVAYAGADGELNLALPDGSYRVTVSRGMRWSVWPPDATETGGQPIVIDGGVENLEAEIAEVVSPPGWVTADLHVHGVRSLDSPVGHEDRVRGYAAAGVDVLVITDHDVVTDFGPTVEQLDLSAEIATISGQEVTTANYGHYNAFPVPYDASRPYGGAYDWGGNGGFGKSPDEIFTELRALPGEQVIQVNHPEVLGFINSTRADPLRMVTFADPKTFRLEPTDPDPETGDTGLWSDAFTAMELLNSYKMGEFWARFRWWLQMVGRGFTPTGTAVTDTHRLRRVESEAPHTYVYVGEDGDTPETLDADGFATAINAGRAFGSTGPFVEVVLDDGNGNTAGLGEVLAAQESVTVRVTIEAPAWVDVDTIDVYTNITEELEAEPGVPDETPIAPSVSTSIVWSENDLEVVAEGQLAHARRRKSVEVELPISADAYVVVMVRSEGRSMFPVANSRGVRPFAFTNPIYVDADGGGFDNPPLQDR